jgi:hypothetical protein
MPGVRGTSGGRDGEEKKMAPWAPRLMLSITPQSPLSGLGVDQF